MRRVKVSSNLYLILIGIFAVLVGTFMSFQIQARDYIPIHKSCDLIEYKTLACVRGDTVYFEFQGIFDSEDLTLRLDDVFVGTLKSQLSISKTAAIRDSYEIEATTDQGYVCPNKGLVVNYGDIAQC